MAGISLVYKVDGFVKCRGGIEALKAYLAAQSQPLKEAATIVTASVMKNFRDGGRPRQWQGLSVLSYFIRAHRQGKANTRPFTLVDTGRLRDSIVPHISQDSNGGTFGAKTNVVYAKKMHQGGVTTASTVMIEHFQRRTKNGTSRVRSYMMHLKGGKPIPARPFMMLQTQDKPVIKQIFAEWMKKSKE